MEFDKAIDIVLGIEGGRVNDSYDPGGETKFGISHKAFPDVDIENLTIEQAKAIYKEFYWDELKIDGFPYILRLIIFDSAVNCGTSQAIKFLQEALNVESDGIMGQDTQEAIDSSDLNKVLGLYAFHRYKFYHSLPTFDRFGNGWVTRVMVVLAQSQLP